MVCCLVYATLFGYLFSKSALCKYACNKYGSMLDLEAYRYVTASCVTRSLCHKYDRMSVWHNGRLTQWAHPYAHCVTPPMLIASHPQRSLCHRLTHTQYYIFTVINSILKFRPKIPMTPFLGLKIHVWPAKINFYFGNQVVVTITEYTFEILVLVKKKIISKKRSV